MPRKNNCINCGKSCQLKRCITCRNLYFKTKEYRKKQSKSHKGQEAWNKGIKFIHSGSFKKGHKGYSGAGEKNSNWKGGRIIDYHGYILIHKPKHPNCNKLGYIQKHRLKMEKHLGRYLKSEEIVCHINGKPSDNRIENLKLFTNKNEYIRNLNSIHKKGENNPNWNGGSSFEPYDRRFNNIFKRKIRKRDNYVCILCNIHQEKLKRTLNIHHINYDKLLTIPHNCCALCISCNIKVNQNRKHWIKFFQSLLAEKYQYQYSETGEIIMEIQK